MLRKIRLDEYLVQTGLASDQKDAQAMVLAGEVRIHGNPAKPSDLIKEPSDVDYRPKAAFVSRGGDKLLGALQSFALSVTGLTCLDVGSSTGGFTECLLKEGAKAIYAVDVGRGLLDQRLREDPRVHVLEGVNFRLIAAPLLTAAGIQVATVDVSFISLADILPKLASVLGPGAQAVVLVKPQFEGTAKEVPGGFVKDEVIRRSILDRVAGFVRTSGFELAGIADATIKGRQGNQETFFHLLKHPA